MRAVADRHHVILLLGMLVLLAWTILWLGGQSPYGRYVTHAAFRDVDINSGFVALAVIVGWLLMIIAMMLPTSLPLVAMFDRMTAEQENHASLVALLVAGYLGIWMLFGVVGYSGDRFLHSVLGQYTWLHTNAWIIGAGILVIAGLYQFTPLKSYCLKKCRSPLGFLMAHWQGGGDGTHALKLGVRHGLFCIGCCWSLMLLMFVVGMGNLGWMFILGAFMAAEKNLPWGQRFSAPLGVMLVGWGSLEAIMALA